MAGNDMPATFLLTRNAALDLRRKLLAGIDRFDDRIVPIHPAAPEISARPLARDRIGSPVGADA